MDPAEEAVEATVEGTVVEGAPSAPSAEAISIQQMPSGGEDDDDDDDDGEDGPPRKKRGGHGRRKIEIEYIEDKIRRHITFSKRKAGISKKAYELSRLTGAQVLLLISSERGQIYSFATPKLQPILVNEGSKALIEQCLNAPDPLNQLTAMAPEPTAVQPQMPPQMPTGVATQPQYMAQPQQMPGPPYVMAPGGVAMPDGTVMSGHMVAPPGYVVAPDGSMPAIMPH